MGIHESNSSFSELLLKLKNFITKYYLQRILEGALRLILISILLYLLSTTLEYHLYLSSDFRRILFWFLILGFIVLGALWIIRPVYEYVSYRARIKEKDAAAIIGSHFPEIQDKLVNVLNLNDMRNSKVSLELVEASINQKSKGLVYIKFNEAINWGRNRKLLRYLILPFLIVFMLILFYPKLLKESTHRIIHYNQVFAPKAPFTFVLKSTKLLVPQFESIELRAALRGESLPEELNVLCNGVSYAMTYRDGEFSTVLKGMEKSTTFRLETLGYLSDEYKIVVVPKAMITNFDITIVPPSYTGLKSKTQRNIGEISAPEGSKILWNFSTKNIEKILLRMNDGSYSLKKNSDGYTTSLILKNVNDYRVVYGNSYSIQSDSQEYSISLIKDEYPMISVQEFKDSLNDISYYAGDAGDDYGVSALFLIVRTGEKTLKYKIAIPQAKNASFHFSTREIFKKFDHGVLLSYYFEVWDNDGVNSPKSTRSSIFQLRKSTESELQVQLDKNSSEIQSAIQKGLKDAKEMQRQLDEARKKLLQKNSMDFNDRKYMEDLLRRESALQNKLEEIRAKIERNFDKKNELTPPEKNILDQQKQLSDMMEQMKSPEQNELLKKIQELMDKSDKREMMNKVADMDSKSEKMEKNMDRLLQIYKNLDYKQKMNDQIDRLDKLAKEQEKTALETELNRNTETKQKKLTQEVKEAEKKMDELKKLNKELGKMDGRDMDKVKEELQEAEQKQEKAEENLKEDKLEDAAKRQREAKDKLNDAKDKLSNLKKKQKKNDKAEDARMMRRVLENIIHLSFEQEKLVEKTKKLSVQSPSYTLLAQNQKKLLEDFKIVEDTLYKIASRQSKVKKMIFEEIEKINSNSTSAISRLVERQSGMAMTEEQYAMAGLNKLGLMISESLKNIEEEGDDEGNESGEMCDNPKKGKKGKKTSMSMEKLAEMQQQLNEQMEALEKKMKEQGGKKPQEGKGQGQKGEAKDQDGNQGSQAKEWAKIAAEQQAIRNALKRLEEQSNSPDKSGKKPFGNGLQEMMDQMNQTERELVNKKIYQETLKRQREIQVKLLETSKAEREQEEENRRESERAKFSPPEMPRELKKYLEEKRINEREIERSPVGLTPYFRTLSEKYFQLIK